MFTALVQWYCLSWILTIVFKVIMQGKLIAVTYNLCTYRNQFFLWEELVNKNRCIGVLLVSVEDKSIEF